MNNREMGNIYFVPYVGNITHAWHATDTSTVVALFPVLSLDGIALVIYILRIFGGVPSGFC